MKDLKEQNRYVEVEIVDFGSPRPASPTEQFIPRRNNRIFDEPREIIGAIPGVRLVEMTHHRVDSLCCGGGGGRMWQDLQGDVKMGEVRIREAEATGAEILITACPLCLIMLEDARKVVGLKEPFRVMDLNELVLEALEN